MQRTVISLMLLCLACSAAVSAQEILPLSQAHPQQLATDPYMGDWQGYWRGADGSNHPLCAQVLALGNGTYEAHLLPAFDRRVDELGRLNGQLTDGEVAFSGELDGEAVQAAIAGGSFDGTGTDIAFHLEKVVRLSPTLGMAPPDAAIVLFEGTNADAWEEANRNPWAIDLKAAFGGDNRAAYMRTTLVSDEAQPVRLELGSDDGVKVWVNGTVVHANNATRGLSPGQDKADVVLAKGKNTILLKVTQGGGDWAACVKVCGRDGKALDGVRVEDASMPLAETGGFIIDWEASGPYTADGKSGPALFDMVFPPEEGGGGWQPLAPPEPEPEAFPWKLLENRAMEVTHGSVWTKQRFGDVQVHIEFRTPFMPEAREQGRGNSGVYLQGRYEVQILDSYGLEGAWNECGGLYKVAAPRVNMCAPPLQWQTYDITFHAPRYDEAGNKTQDALLTVLHNGVVIHNHAAVPGETTAAAGGAADEAGPLYLQDHGNPVWYRNIWAVPLD